MMTALPIISLITGAVGAGVSYAAAQSAASTQEQMALLNAQAQTQTARQTGQVNQMQAAINATLAEKDEAAARANAAMLDTQAETASSASREATRRAREEAARVLAAQRAAIAKSGFVDTTGSPLLLLADTAGKTQQQADNLRFEDEESRRALFRESALTRNQAILAGINATGQRASGLAAAQLATAEAAKAKLELYSQRAAASAARTQAVGGLFTAFGGLASDSYKNFYNKPGKLGTKTTTSGGTPANGM